MKQNFLYVSYNAAIYISGSWSYSSQWDLILQSCICYGV